MVNKRLLLGVMKVVRDLGDNKGSSAGQILSLLHERTAGTSKAPVTHFIAPAQLKKVLKHALDMGLLRYRAGLYQVIVNLEPGRAIGCERPRQGKPRHHHYRATATIGKGNKGRRLRRGRSRRKKRRHQRKRRRRRSRRSLSQQRRRLRRRGRQRSASMGSVMTFKAESRPMTSLLVAREGQFLTSLKEEDRAVEQSGKRESSLSERQSLLKCTLGRRRAAGETRVPATRQENASHEAFTTHIHGSDSVTFLVDTTR
uniref:H15 domain-containing protein n=1 Tax=Timema poppense TaxID=170557 RepID=A0A7R9GWS8_TIMPO|nr:unnamed protein product [Timema poppensis]